MSAEEFEVFQRLVTPLLADWNKYAVRAIARRGLNEKWILDCLRVILGGEEQLGHSSDELPKLPDLLVCEERKDIASLRDFLRELAKGDLNLGSEHVDIRRPNTSPPNPMLHIQKWSRFESRARFGIDFACYVLTGGDSFASMIPRDTIDTVNARLRALAPPWDGLPDLRRNFVGIEEELAARHDWTSIEVVAPIGVRLANCKLTDDLLTTEVKTRGAVALDQIILSIVATTPGKNAMRIRRSLEGESRGHDGVLDAKIELHGPLVWGSALLTYRGMDADRHELYGRVEPSSNPRLAAMQEVAGGGDILLESLRESKGKQLEEWAAVLFNALGFSATRYGFLSDAPDVLAFSESHHWFFVIECTGREPDLGGKLTKLATRTKELARATGFRAYPVVVTGLNRDLLNKTDLEKAMKEQIAVLSIDELPALFHLALKGTDQIGVRAYLENLIPKEAGTAWSRWPT